MSSASAARAGDPATSRPRAGPATRRARTCKDFADFLKSVPDDKPFCFWFGSSDPHRPYEKGSGAKSGLKAEDVVVPPYFPDTPLGAAGGDRRQPAEATRRHSRERLSRQGGAVRQPLRRLRDPARLSSGRSRVHGRLQGRARRDHPPRREDALRDLARHGAEGDRGRPQGLRRRLLRDERPRLRA